MKNFVWNAIQFVIMFLIMFLGFVILEENFVLVLFGIVAGTAIIYVIFGIASAFRTRKKDV